MSRSTVEEDTRAPAQVLIPEARDRQRRRYRRSAVLGAIAALLIGLLVALLVMAASIGSGTAGPTPRPMAALVATGTTVLVRPVLCFAPAYDATAPTGNSGALPACGGPYLLTASALDVIPTHNGYSSKRWVPDPALAGSPSSASDAPDRTVLLGAPRTDPSGGRAVLGPSELRLSATDVRSVVTRKDRAGVSNVTLHLSAEGAAAWDRLAQENFHQFLAIDIGGKVVNMSLVQPYRTAVASLDGKVVISGSLARSIASALKG